MSIFALLPPLPPFLFSLLVVSGLASKALHIALHFQSLPFLYFVLYSPTLVLPDVLVIISVRVLLRFQAPESRWQWLSTVLGGALSLITWGASSIQFGFFMQTGAEVAWAAGGSFLSDPAAMKILLSGISTVSAAATVLGLVSWLLHSYLYNLTGLGLQAIRDLCTGGFRARYTLISAPSKSCMASINFRSLCRIIPAVILGFSLIFLELTRPAVPYDHLSGALPLTLLEAFQKKTATVEGCREPAVPFPLMVTDSNGESRPQFEPDSIFVEQWSRAPWLPENPPRGFSRWELSPSERAEKDNSYSFVCGGEEGAFYNPNNDPLMISNLGGEIYEPLQKAFEKHSVQVNHVVLLTLESGRKDLFPTQQGTPLFEGLLASHKKQNVNAAIDRLVTMTPVAQQLTGEFATDSNGTKVDLSHSPWQSPPQEGMGGLNVRGAVTGSSLTFKSVLGSHCGVNPLPVDLLEESALEIYQPCLPQIFELFNQGKSHSQRRPQNSSQSQSAAVNYPWKSVFMQSITDDYDRQDVLNENMGFKHKIVKSNLQSPHAKYRAKGKEINYFGYAENELHPYVLDLFEEAANNKTRMFFSHVTSTTHHPWSTPEDFKKEPYVSDQGNINHDLMNNYLNAARFVDIWLGDIMNMLDQTGIANETLVVVVGDHGQAFGEDNKDMTGTYENGHISNFRVPLVFHHPHMPRVDITANATALTIIPTILDLLVQSNSLDERDSKIASSLLPEYQGQSLLRPFLPSMNEPSQRRDSQDQPHQPPREEQPENGGQGPQPEARSQPDGPAKRSSWNMGLINAGGSMLSVMAADVPYRLILPLKEGFEYTFTHLSEDPGEKHMIKAWTLDSLTEDVEAKYGKESASWLKDAEQVGLWWVNEQKRIWGYREA